MKKTKFYELHKKAGAKIVEFAGYEMPVQYSSIIAEHKQSAIRLECLMFLTWAKYL